MFEHLLESLPVAAFPLTSTVKPLVDHHEHLLIVAAQHLVVAADTIIIPVSL